MYDAVIFDNDGVLLTLTSMDAHREGAREALVEAGADDPDNEAIETMSIGVTVEKLEDICATYDLDPAQTWRIRDRVLSEKQQAEMRAGEKTPYDDIHHLERFECPLGVVSSNQQATVEFAYDHFDLHGHFETVHARPPTIESLRRKKPEPYYVEAAMESLGAERPLFVGDNESDVQAAEAAGIDSAFIRRPHRTEFDLSVTPDHEVHSLEDVLALTDGPSA